MSKGEKKDNSWPYLEGRCELIFGKDRFFHDEDKINIIFDMDDPIQVYENNHLVLQFQKHGVEYKSDVNCVRAKGSLLFLAKDRKVMVTVNKDDLDEDIFNEWLLPLVNFTQEIGGNTRRYRGFEDNDLVFLNAFTEVPWVRKVPTPYSNDSVLMLAQQTPSISQDQRAEQEHLLAQICMPRRARPSLRAREWVERQREVEGAADLPVATGIPADFFPEDEDSVQHRLDATRSQKFLHSVRRAFAPAKSR